MESTANRRVPASDTAHLSRLEEQLFTLTQGPGTSDRSRAEASLPTNAAISGQSFAARLGQRRVGIMLLVAGLGASVWWWTSGIRTAPAEPTRPDFASATAPAPEREAIAQLQSVAGELGALRQMIDQLRADQERVTSAIETLSQQVRQSEEQVVATRNSIAELSRTIDPNPAARGLDDLAERLRSIQAQMSRDSELTSERLKANEDQLRRVIALRTAPSPGLVSSVARQQPAPTAAPKSVSISGANNASPPPKKPQLSTATRPAPAR